MKQCYVIVWSVEKIQKVKTQKLQRQEFYKTSIEIY